MPMTHKKESAVDYKKVVRDRIFYKYPPRINKEEKEGFGQTALKKVAKEKLSELYKQKEAAKAKLIWVESIDWILGVDDIETQLKYKVELYGAIQELHYLDLWIGHWKRLGDLFPKREHKAGYSDEEVQQAREYPLENLIPSPRRVGTRTTCPCPFHNPKGEREKSPSFFIYSDGSYHCFSCGAHGGNAIDFVMANENLGFKEAVGRLA